MPSSTLTDDPVGTPPLASFQALSFDLRASSGWDLGWLENAHSPRAQGPGGCPLFN